MRTLSIPMNTEFAVTWKGFTPDEKRKLKNLWSRCQFPPEFCAAFEADVYKGGPGGDGGIFIHAKDVRLFRGHDMAELGYSSLEELVRLANRAVTSMLDSVSFCPRCGKPTEGDVQCAF